MLNESRLTPGRKCLTGPNAQTFENSIIESSYKTALNRTIVWGSLNVCFLSILLYDILKTSPIYVSYLQYIEYVGVVILSINVLFHLVTYVRIKVNINKPLTQSPSGTPPRSTVRFMDQYTPINAPLTPMNLSSSSWMCSSPFSPNKSNLNTSLKSTSWTFVQGSDLIKDEQTLNAYLNDFEAHRKVNSLSNNEESSTNTLNSFWIHPKSKNSKDVSSYLKNCHYQLSTPPTNFASSSPKNDSEKGSALGQGMETWRRLQIDPMVLTQWNANLRIWLSQTILSRLVNEFDSIDESFQKYGFGDVQIGKVGLDRLRKTSQTAPVLQFIQTLPTLIPFLELTPNQEYLVKRVRELAKGGCMSDFKWNSGSTFNGKEWDSNLPTDSAIVMHLFASYMDTQLQPLPNKPDLKAFSGYHFFKLKEKPNFTSHTLGIQQCSDYPPHYQVVVGEDVYEVVKGYNNLFHSILLFLYYVNKREHGMLGQVNLGKSGVNLLWVIQS